MRGLLATTAAMLAVLALGGMKWWQGTPLNGGLRAHLTLAGGCSSPSAPAGFCQQLESQPLQVVVYGPVPDGNKVLTADADGNLNAALPPGTYTIAFSLGDWGSITNRGRRPIRVVSGHLVDIGRIQPDDALVAVASSSQDLTQP